MNQNSENDDQYEPAIHGSSTIRILCIALLAFLVTAVFGPVIVGLFRMAIHFVMYAVLFLFAFVAIWFIIPHHKKDKPQH